MDKRRRKLLHAAAFQLYYSHLPVEDNSVLFVSTYK